MLAIAVALMLLASPAPNVSGSPAISASLDNVTLGDPLATIHQRHGDPVSLQEIPKQSQRIWRFLENGNRFLDILERNGVAVSITVAKYTKEAAFTDQRGISFGTSSDTVTQKLGPPQKVERNADDGSLDLWYRAPEAATIYEFAAGRLAFEQLLAPREKQDAYPPGPAVQPRGGTSLADAIVASSPGDRWIRAYFALNACDSNGEWETVSAHSVEKGYTYEVIHATCSSGNLMRDFYFQLPEDRTAFQFRTWSSTI